LDTHDSKKESYKPVEKPGFPPLADFFWQWGKQLMQYPFFAVLVPGRQVTQAASCLSLDYWELQGCLTHSAYKIQQPKCFWNTSHLKLHFVSFILT